MARLLLGSMLLLTACGLDGAERFRQGIPSSSAVALRAPGSTSTALSGTGTRRDGLEGQTADFYRITRDVTVMVNSGTVSALELVHRITRYPATTQTQDAAIWGPHTDALSPNTWKLTVQQLADQTYGYRLEGKAKAEADSAFRVILSGEHTIAGPNLGSGHFLVDFTLANQLPEHDDNSGTVAVTYARPSLSAPTVIDAVFAQVRDGAALVDATYHFTSTLGQGGLLDFDLTKDFVAGPGVERGEVRSRWLESGAGRADVKATGGDLPGPVTINECWDSSFASRYLSASFSPSLSYGTEGLCAFATVEYAAL